MAVTLVHSSILFLCFTQIQSFWDFGTTTPYPVRDDLTPRQSFFRWQRSIPSSTISYGVDRGEVLRRRRLYCIAGVSIDMTPLATAVILNRRVLITAANFLEPHMNRQRDLRVWALGYEGTHITPYRYRVWKFRRLFPRSNNPEHWHGPRGNHVPRHDVVVIQTMDQIYLHDYIHSSYQYAIRALLTGKHQTLKRVLWYAGSGYEYPLHIKENYKIFYTNVSRNSVVNCERYLSKWWGKFICVRNEWGFTALQSGGGLFTTDVDIEDKSRLVGLGCFEIRFNQDRILVFTDLRYYVDFIKMYANITRGEYYEYNYQCGAEFWGLFTYHYYIPELRTKSDYFPLG